MEEETPDKEIIKARNHGNAGVFLSPEGFLMIVIAILVDGGECLVEFIPGAGQILSIIIDIFAVIFFGFWMWFRSGTIKVTTKSFARLGEITKWMKRLKWLRPLCFIIELLPIVSSFLPLWILIVYLELKHH